MVLVVLACVVSGIVIGHVAACALRSLGMEV